MAAKIIDQYYIKSRLLHILIKVLIKLVKYIFIWAVINAILLVILLNIDEPFKDFYVDKDLKDNFIVLTDTRPIVYRDNSGFQRFVLPFGVKEVAADNKWIIAASEGLDAKCQKFLVILHYETK